MEKSHAEERAVNPVISRWIRAKEIKCKGQREPQPDKPQLPPGPPAPRFGRRTTLTAALRVMRDLKKKEPETSDTPKANKLRSPADASYITATPEASLTLDTFQFRFGEETLRTLLQWTNLLLGFLSVYTSPEGQGSVMRSARPLRRARVLP